VESKLEEYEKADRMDKTLLAETIVRKVKGVSGRFLRQDGESWIEVDDDAARDKISYTFRSQRKAKLRGSDFYAKAHTAVRV
jgi:hypothetical protein